MFFVASGGTHSSMDMYVHGDNRLQVIRDGIPKVGYDTDVRAISY